MTDLTKLVWDIALPMPPKLTDAPGVSSQAGLGTFRTRDFPEYDTPREMTVLDRLDEAIRLIEDTTADLPYTAEPIDLTQYSNVVDAAGNTVAYSLGRDDVAVILGAGRVLPALLPLLKSIRAALAAEMIRERWRAVCGHTPQQYRPQPKREGPMIEIDMTDGTLPADFQATVDGLGRFRTRDFPEYDEARELSPVELLDEAIAKLETLETASTDAELIATLHRINDTTLTILNTVRSELRSERVRDRDVIDVLNLARSILGLS